MFGARGGLVRVLAVLSVTFQLGSVHTDHKRGKNQFRPNSLANGIKSLYQPFHPPNVWNKGVSAWKGSGIKNVSSTVWNKGVSGIKNGVSGIKKGVSGINNVMDDPIFNELLDKVPRLPKPPKNMSLVKWLPTYILDDVNHVRKRAVWDLSRMMKCSTGCNPLIYKGYGCYCGFLGSGNTVDGIDRCCKMHDWCYTKTSCMLLKAHLPYFVPYKWKCNGGAPYCIIGKKRGTEHGSCSHHLCECDREFASCLAQYPCPRSKAMCMSPWRYWQNLFMGLGTGGGMHDPRFNEIHGRPHPLKPTPLMKYPKPIFHTNKVNLEFTV